MGDKYYGHTVSRVDKIEVEAPTRTSAPENQAVQFENTGTSTFDTTLPQRPSGVNTEDMQNGEKRNKKFAIKERSAVEGENARLRELNRIKRVENKNPTKSPDIRYSIKERTKKVNPGARKTIREEVAEMPKDGYRIPHLAMPDEIMVGTDGAKITDEKIPSAIRKYMLSLFRGKVLVAGSDHKVYIDRDSVKHYAYPVGRLSRDLKTAKMVAGANLDVTLREAIFLTDSADDGRHPEATGGWDNFYAMFETDTGVYSGIVKTMNTNRGRVFYDITEIEKEEGILTAHGDNEINSPPARKGPSSSATTLPQGPSGVNTEDMQNGEKRNSKFAISERSAVEKIAKSILKNYSSDYDAETLTAQLQGFYDAIASGKDPDGSDTSYRETKRSTLAAAEAVLERSVEFQTPRPVRGISVLRRSPGRQKVSSHAPVRGHPARI